MVGRILVPMTLTPGVMTVCYIRDFSDVIKAINRAT